MKNKLIILNFLFSFAVLAQAQNNKRIIDNLKNVLDTTTQDHERVLAMVALCNEFSTISFDSANKYGQRALELAKRTNFISGEIKSLCFLGIANTRQGEIPKALQLQFRGLQIAQDNKLETDEAICLFGIGHSYFFLRDYSTSINYCKKARQLFLNSKGEKHPFYAYFNPQNDKTRSIYTEDELVLGEAYLYINQLDSAIVLLQKLGNQLTDPVWINPYKDYLGYAYFKSGKQQLGLQYLRENFNYALGNRDYYSLAWTCSILSECFKEIRQVDSSIYYAKLGLSKAQQVGFKQRILATSQLLADEYEHIDINESNKYLKLAFAANNELFGPQKVFELQKTLAEQLKHQGDAEKQQIAYKNRIRQNVFIVALSVIMIIAMFLYRNNRQKQKANELLKKQKQEIEEQRKQAEIEVALERVRSRSLAMHHTDELKEVITVVLHSLQEIGLAMAKRSAIILTFEQDSKDHIQWVASPEHASPAHLRVPYFDNVILTDIWDAREKQIAFLSKSYSVEEKNAMFGYFFKLPGLKDLPAEEKNYLLGAEYYEFSVAHKKHSSVGIANFTNTPLTAQYQDILMRFANVFEQAYIRFLDLQKAEEQAREAMIEVALERVRARTMAMQKSDELAETASVVFHQLQSLGVVRETDRFSIGIINEETGILTGWITKPGGEQKSNSYHLPMKEFSTFNKAYHHWKKLPKQLRKEFVLAAEYKGRELAEFTDYIARHTDFLSDVNSLLNRDTLEKVNLIDSFFSHGSLSVSGFEELDDSARNILKRFSAVFEQTYTRFLDLEKAETQAREAQIEAALERVRSKTMAMHNSQDVGETASVMFDELIKLGVETSVRCGVLIIDKTKHMEVWAAASNKEGKVSLLIGSLDMSIHPLLQQLYSAWENKEPHFLYELRGDDLKNYYCAITNAPDYPFQYDMQLIPDEQMTNLFFFPEGGLFAFTVEPLSDEVARLFKRFAAVFGLTYRRFLDLQKAEAQTREAIKQASVDRIRAEIASMRSTTDLERITPLIWNELTTLGVPFIRCGVFIMNETNRVIHTYLSTPDGQALAAFQLSFDADGIGKEALGRWRKNQIYTTHWTAEEFAAFSKGLVNRGAVESDEKYRTPNPPTSLDLHFFPFLQGMLYVGNVGPLQENEMNMVQSLAQAFSTAYARYEDFNKLEQAKQQVDKTLTELKATQAQLIQSEKMASLGELTAGIAHEIQNPLNFVNNFSEVNTELIGEMQQEIDRGDYEEAKSIAGDIKENQQKISHHGKRADAIVKGMLQHSRSSTGVKELTDIKVLVDEYIRLCYHGLRAKDKSFNATIKTDFDNTVDKINIIPQDIGRVILNLLTNAFYAVNEKKKLQGEGYEPIVSVTTKKENDKVVIAVRDNGNGIPQKVVDKIFQPFFTTKPTGEGTGLGLSMSYDIITKGHSGELLVRTEENKGSEFIVVLSDLV